ncbi:MAG: hypothetical protein ACPGO5_03805 [Patescibacteria group bacterium]
MSTEKVNGKLIREILCSQSKTIYKYFLLKSSGKILALTFDQSGCKEFEIELSKDEFDEEVRIRQRNNAEFDLRRRKNEKMRTETLDQLVQRIKNKGLVEKYNLDVLWPDLF